MMTEQNQTPVDKTIVLILSAMRTGSTLLKALLAVAPDVSNLPETNFQRYTGPHDFKKMRDLSRERIVVLKRPSWFNELTTYPHLPPFPRIKKIVLIRDVYETVRSLHKMVFRGLAPHFPSCGHRFLAERYWTATYENLLALEEHDQEQFIRVRYESLVQNPVEETARLFEFIGSEQPEGVRAYSPPSSFQWKWGSDDGGAKIQTLEVQAPKPTQYTNTSLVRIIEASERILHLRKKLGYDEWDP